jgi:hypothetical protein
MAKAIRWSKSYKELAKFYDTSESALKSWAKKGVNLEDSGLVTPLVEKWKRSHFQKPAQTSIPRAPIQIKCVESEGIEGAISRAREVALALYKRYIEAEAKGDDRSSVYRQEWMDAAEFHLKIEKDSPAVKEANKSTITTSVLREVWNDVFVQLRVSLEGMPIKVTEELPHDIAPLILKNIREQVNIYIEKLSQCQFLEGTDDK